MKQLIELSINGLTYDAVVSPEDLLIDVMRQQLGLVGTKKGCGQGDCGTCTVLIEGRRALACLTLAITCRDKHILTIEGLETDGKLDPIQEAFVEEGAVQCGFCTPGMVMAALGLLAWNPNPSDAEIRRALADNLCRCGSHARILEAVRRAAEAMAS